MIKGKVQVDIQKVTKALQSWVHAVAELKDLGVVRSQRVVTDYAEWLVAEIYGGTRARSKTQRDWDVILGTETIQVKAHAKAEDNPNRCSTISANPENFDALVIVVFSSNLRVREFYSVPSKDVVGLLRQEGKSSRLYWGDLRKWQIPSEELPNYDTLAPLFD